MKKLLILWSSSLLLLFACQNEAPDHDEKNEHDSTMNKMQKDKPVSFAKIETLPSGIDSIFGKAPSKEVGYYKFSFPRADLRPNSRGRDRWVRGSGVGCRRCRSRRPPARRRESACGRRRVLRRCFGLSWELCHHSRRTKLDARPQREREYRKGRGGERIA